jgi:hypothetical protein
MSCDSCITTPSSSKSVLNSEIINTGLNCSTTNDVGSISIGVLHGLSGVFGLSSYWDIYNTQDQEKMTKSNNDLAQWLKDCQISCAFAEASDERKNISSTIDLIKSNQDIMNEIFSEEIQVNFVLTGFSLALVFIVIVYLLFQPKKSVI